MDSVKKTKGLLYVALLPCILCGCATDGNKAVNEYKTQPTVSTQTTPENFIPRYKIVDRKISDTEIKTQVTLHAVVSGTLTEAGLNTLLVKLYDEANATRGFTHFGGKPTHVAIWLYMSEDDFKSGQGLWIANLQKIGDGSTPEIKVKTELLAYHNTGPQVKHDLSESKSKEIFKALIMAADRAEAEADRMYPWPSPNVSHAKATEQIRKNAEALESLTEKYKSEVAKRYGITQEQRKDINMEGIMKDWPMPPRR